MSNRGIRGAITVTTNDASAILEATHQLLGSIQIANASLKPEDIASALFTMTTDLNAVYPAKAARQMGWSNVPPDLCPGNFPFLMDFLSAFGC